MNSEIPASEILSDEDRAKFFYENVLSKTLEEAFKYQNELRSYLSNVYVIEDLYGKNIKVKFNLFLLLKNVNEILTHTTYHLSVCN